jgi:hypothetical protein
VHNSPNYVAGGVLDELANRVAAGMAHDLPVPFY